MISNGPVLAGPRMIEHIGALLNLLDLHQPNEFDLCMSCDRLWPCPTVMVVTGVPAADDTGPDTGPNGAGGVSTPATVSATAEPSPAVGASAQVRAQGPPPGLETMPAPLPAPPVTAPMELAARDGYPAPSSPAAYPGGPHPGGPHPSGPLPTAPRPARPVAPAAMQGPGTGAYPVSATAGNPTGWIPSSTASLSTGAHRIPRPLTGQAGTPTPQATGQFPAVQPPQGRPQPGVQPPQRPPAAQQPPAPPQSPTAAQPPGPAPYPMPPSPRQRPTGPIQPLGREQQAHQQPAPWNGSQPSGQPLHGPAIPAARPAPVISGPMGIPPTRMPAQPFPAEPAVSTGNGMARRAAPSSIDPAVPSSIDRAAADPQQHHPRYPHPAAPRADVPQPANAQHPGTPPQHGTPHDLQAQPGHSPRPGSAPDGTKNRDGGRWPGYGNILDGIDVI